MHVSVEEHAHTGYSIHCESERSFEDTMCSWWSAHGCRGFVCGLAPGVHWVLNADSIRGAPEVLRAHWFLWFAKQTVTWACCEDAMTHNAV